MAAMSKSSFPAVAGYFIFLLLTLFPDPILVFLVSVVSRNSWG